MDCGEKVTVGGLKSLEALRKRILRLAGPECARTVTEAVTEEMDRQVRACFAEARDPNGVRWKPRKPPTGGWPLLYKTGEGYSSIRVESTRGGFGSIRIRMLKHMVFQNNGTDTIEARSFTPTGGRLGLIWGPAIKRAAAGALREILMSNPGAL